MKRDLDLARQLLLDIENRGTDCSVSVLRSGSNHQSEEQVRYHLRLLIDAGLLKEIDRTSAGIPCVRLTHEGHELLELARSEPRWREAKYACQERLGGLSLTVIRGILLRWAVAATSRSPVTSSMPRLLASCVMRPTCRANAQPTTLNRIGPSLIARPNGWWNATTGKTTPFGTITFVMTTVMRTCVTRMSVTSMFALKLASIVSGARGTALISTAMAVSMSNSIRRCQAT